MAITRQVVQYGGARLARRLGKAVPVLGALVALFTLRSAIRRKGMRRGVVDTALDATPVVGTAKAVYEMARGDIIPDRRM
ncbi:hypothetical protein TBR22_A42500 [Luteitalea sp. TBR-22]|uniref:hypothetical protein n=1 Tax=Luteitalea sp. TBR-22 TaxID=2802971 RepID=UPI001AF3A534|nr:hypothetical protein [Luteitalea sp. TBR-22]BCS35024.1 hypothetical protein TBR22_A42500 [Luteitalea sp. TBR-22]